ncbi:heat-inducible transcriptional repressor HrcA [Fimbriimonas ginsengisoli]|uniref:Heat-inducible transcription repressor HrcA n=1 Tax=Fimbriimonas ginsengisoli Gsoil 348 TaxID=661478 RepID=A0A068NV02_FIMGI|nr:heat-inducible transcriptional repressor HrcA [Fimbriimonas ginsengisoli]AIE87373.1 Heat-inducible transcription repressor HrcA [Fimbriimonas ginsengisoli Gsoil 348]
MPELDSRKQTVLQAIVLEYITTAEPVASEMLVQKYDLGVKSATIRNEMAEMSELGFLEQPHTSAGRIPSDLGYRYYVDRLIVQRHPGEAEKQRLRDATDDGEALHTLLRDTMRALSRVTHLLGVATTVRDTSVTVRTAVFSALGPSQALLVLVLSNGHVENRMIECPPGLTLEDIGKTNEALTLSIGGKDLRNLSKIKTSGTLGNPAVDKLMGVLTTTIRSIARELTRGKMITEGEEFLFAQPEFQRDAGMLADLLHQMSESAILYEAVTPGEAVRPVIIGRENRNERMRQLSVVRHSFFVGENEAGVVALVGPTRMRYDASIPLVSYTAKALSDSLTRFFG